MCRFNGPVPEVLLHAEQVDPALGNGEPNGHVLAGNLSEFA